jgi:hypothetical protein
MRDRDRNDEMNNRDEKNRQNSDLGSSRNLGESDRSQPWKDQSNSDMDRNQNRSGNIGGNRHTEGYRSSVGRSSGSDEVNRNESLNPDEQESDRNRSSR